MALSDFKRLAMQRQLQDDGTIDDPVLSIQRACKFGTAGVVPYFRGRIPWGKLGWDEDTRTHHPDSYVLIANSMWTEDAAIELLDAAEADGSTAASGLYQPFLMKDMVIADGIDFVRIVEPIHSLINMGKQRIILRFLENGLDPEAIGIDGTRSPLQLAIDFKRPGMADMMRSFATRKRVGNILQRGSGLAPCTSTRSAFSHG